MRETLSFNNIDGDSLSYRPLSLALMPPSLGIRKFLGSSIENGKKDYFFQIDSHLERYLLNKKACLLSNKNEYLQDQLSVYEKSKTYEFFEKHLQDEYPKYFDQIKNSIHKSEDKLTALINLVPADICLVDKTDLKLKYVHLCSANQWSASWGIGKNFKELHNRLEHFDKLLPRIERLLLSFKQGDFFERLGGVTLTTNSYLNRHPKLQYSIVEKDFDPKSPELYLRFERQLLTLIPETNLIVFSIRTYLTDLIHTTGKNLDPLLGLLKDETNSHHPFIKKNSASLNSYIFEQ